MFCSKCGFGNEEGSRFCAKCGFALSGGAQADQLVPAGSTPGGIIREPQVSTGDKLVQTQKSPGLASVLSCLVPGMGQFYNGDVKKGLAMLVITVVLVVPTGGLVWLGMIIWSAVDAYKVASRQWKMW